MATSGRNCTLSTASTLLIGIAAFFIAYQQFRLSRSKLRFDLYEKRLAVFKTVRNFASELAMRDKVDAGALYRDTIERRFLFEEDVYSYIERMYERARRLESNESQFATPNLPDDVREHLKNAIVVDRTWFFDQSDEMIQVFSKDLSIKTLRY